MKLDDWFELDPYGLEQGEKGVKTADYMRELCRYHYEACPEYKAILDTLGVDIEEIDSPEMVPYVPVRLFKNHYLHSVPEEEITRVMTSSGTTGQQVSRIALSADNAKAQQKALSRIVASYVGENRLPLMILDSKRAIKDRKMFSARGAGILGFSIFGKDTTYALDEDMKPDLGVIEEFLKKHGDEPILLFGYTYMIWKEFYLNLKEAGQKVDFGKGSRLFHVGGWKKLQDLAVDKDEYAGSLREQCGIEFVHNYYGMAEQLGSIFVECEEGHLHTSIYSDVIIRDSEDFSEVSDGEAGLMEVMSVLPTSYPGHAILTEDKGRILGVDDCPCGRKGKYFEILGRIARAEVRGCSDTYQG
ncbi:MAG: acyl-protein synthetase [Eubacterium sp.]|nr:acyl-protein synthetase [Eubacterium sp.]